jgi:hypothetical protein
LSRKKVKGNIMNLISRAPHRAIPTVIFLILATVIAWQSFGVIGNAYTNVSFSAAEGQVSTNPASSSDSSNVTGWGNLRGVDYFVNSSVSPSSFSELAANGWNLLRVAMTWEQYDANSSAFVSQVQYIASEADEYNLSIIWDLDHQTGGDPQVGGGGFPNNITSPYLSDQAFWVAWYNSKVTNGWKDYLSYEETIVKTVDAYRSTLGYEIMNEPPIYSTTGVKTGFYNFTGFGEFNTYVASGLRTITSKTIIYMHPYPNPWVNYYGLLSTITPQVSKLAMDFHWYSQTFSSTLFSTLINFTQANGIKFWIGEFAPCIGGGGLVCAINNTTEVTSFIQNVMDTAKADNAAWTYYLWGVGTPYIQPWQSLLTSKQNQWWLDTEIVALQTQVYG